MYGEFRTGKTQLAHTMSVVCQLPPDMGGAAGKVSRFVNLDRLSCERLKVAYVDTEGTFRPDRIRSIADRFGVNGDMALENILYGMLVFRSPPRYERTIRSFSSRIQ